jgi:hypothetical protein
MEEIMKTAVTPSNRYPIGKIYQGKPIWRPDGGESAGSP